MLKLMDEQLQFVRWVSERLDSAGIAYMLTGSIAMAVYTEPRMTRDLDLVIECRPADDETIVRLFGTDCYLDPDAVRRAIECRSMFNVIHQQWITKADFIVRKEEPYRRAEFERKKQLKVDGIKVWVVAPEDLILSKLAWSLTTESAQQERDVRALIGSVKDLDWDYLARWAGSLGVASRLVDLRT